MPIIGKGAARILGIDLDKVPEKTVHSTDWLECDDCGEKKENIRLSIEVLKLQVLEFENKFNDQDHGLCTTMETTDEGENNER